MHSSRLKSSCHSPSVSCLSLKIVLVARETSILTVRQASAVQCERCCEEADVALRKNSLHDFIPKHIHAQLPCKHVLLYHRAVRPSAPKMSYALHCCAVCTSQEHRLLPVQASWPNSAEPCLHSNPWRPASVYSIAAKRCVCLPVLDAQALQGVCRTQTRAS